MAQGIQLSVPGKTFVVGEYLALKGGPSILACTEPRFVLNLFPKQIRSELLSPFTEQSPAGKFFKDHSKFFSHWEIKFFDPYQGRGGFGASTAQFALVYMAELIMRDGELNSEDLQWAELLRDYHLYSFDGKGEPPSGADLIAQLTGQLVLYDGQSLDVQSVNWPFKDHGFLLFHTGKKLATHEHLKSQLVFPVEQLRLIAQKATKNLVSSDFPGFVSAVQLYGECLAQNGFLADHSKGQLELIKSTGAVEGAKACGAMGSDVIFVIYEKNKRFSRAEDWRTWLKSQPDSQLDLVASDETLSVGLKVEEIQE